MLVLYQNYAGVVLCTSYSESQNLSSELGTSMLDVEIIRSPGQPARKFIESALRDAIVCKIATAYLTGTALDYFERHFERILDHRGTVSVIHGADGQVTSPDAIKRLVSLSFQYEEMNYRVHSPMVQPEQRLFHPKIYFTRDVKQNYVSIVGSSNATYKGLSKNIEVNVVFRGKRRDSVITQCSNALDALMQDHEAVEPSAEWIKQL